jgi:glycosyltransferase involved in cell wall biosynthesis
MRPAISVVLPVRDAAATVAASVESVRAQSERSWELIAVDDGSTDDSPAILHAVARRDPRIRVIVRPRRGLVAALLDGLAAASADLVARMDADDVCRPDRLERQRAHLAAVPAVGLVASRVAFGGTAAGFARYVAWTNGLLAHDDIAAARFVESPLIHPSVMFRRHLIERHGAYRAGDFPEDYELWLRWLEAGVRMEKLAEPLLVWNDAPARLSRTDRRYAVDAFARVKAGYLARWLARHNPHHPDVVVWGAGRVTRQRVRHLQAAGVRVAAWVDIDPAKIGRRLDGVPVLGPDDVPPPGRCLVLSFVASHGAREQIAARLDALGHVRGRHWLPAA